MVPFAGYLMPVQYEGIMAEHLWTREHAGLFDVSHMGQLTFHGPRVDAALETLMPGELQLLKDARLADLVYRAGSQLRRCYRVIATGATAVPEDARDWLAGQEPVIG